MDPVFKVILINRALLVVVFLILFQLVGHERTASYCRDRDMQMSHSLTRSRRTS